MSDIHSVEALKRHCLIYSNRHEIQDAAFPNYCLLFSRTFHVTTVLPCHLKKGLLLQSTVTGLGRLHTFFFFPRGYLDVLEKVARKIVFASLFILGDVGECLILTKFCDSGMFHTESLQISHSRGGGDATDGN